MIKDFSVVLIIIKRHRCEDTHFHMIVSFLVSARMTLIANLFHFLTCSGLTLKTERLFVIRKQDF